MAQRTINFKQKYGDAGDISTIISRVGELARATGVGTSVDDILAALAATTLTLQRQPTPIATNAPNLSLTELLERSAAVLEAYDPLLAAELRRRKKLVREAIG